MRSIKDRRHTKATGRGQPYGIRQKDNGSIRRIKTKAKSRFVGKTKSLKQEIKKPKILTCRRERIDSKLFKNVRPFKIGRICDNILGVKYNMKKPSMKVVVIFQKGIT